MRRFLRPAGLLGAVALVACSSGDDRARGAAASSGAAGAGGAVAATTSPTTDAVVTSASSGAGGLPESFEVFGVVTDGDAPVEGALVLQGGAEPSFVTGADGAFTLTLSTSVPGTPTLVAAKVGYRSAGVEITELPGEPLVLVLRLAAPPDNAGYIYGDPGKGDPALDTSTAVCGHCHTSLVADFQGSAHARSARDPRLLDLYDGTSGHADAASCGAAGGVWKAGLLPGTEGTPKDKCYAGRGVLPDLNPTCGGMGALACDDPAIPVASAPVAFGGCADCHAPAIDGALGGRDLHDAVGNAYENGNHCDLCHHVRDVDLAKPPGTAGRLVIQRPSETASGEPGAQLLQVMYGPLPDVPNAFMGGSYAPLFRGAVLCAGCHEQLQEALVPGEALDAARWPLGLPTHSTYSEWAESPYGTEANACPSCHMPADTTGLVNAVDVTTPEQAGLTFGFARPPGSVRRHVFRGPLDGEPRLADGAVALFLTGHVEGAELVADVALQNIGAGHAVPTGEPMRALLLLVDAVACGAPLAPSGGVTIPDTGGALAEGAVGIDVTVAGASLGWIEGAARAKAGDVVRVVRPTGLFDDYAGVGFFADPSLDPAQKGIEIRVPVGEATVLDVSAGAIELDASLALLPGDRVYLGDARAGAPEDGEPAKALAGAAGYAFARALVGQGGERHVPHYRARDIASDNRLAPMALATTTHAFAAPAGCGEATLTATLLYRPVPVGLARERAWDARDYVIARGEEIVALR